jgi:hypothetical protein
LKHKLSEVANMISTINHNDNNKVIGILESKLSVVCNHLMDLVDYMESGIDYIEAMLYKQLLSAIGRELTVADFSNYMNYHYRKLYVSEYQPEPFSYAVRRSALHSPEGSLRIESDYSSIIRSNDTIASVSDGVRLEPVLTFSRPIISNSVNSYHDDDNSNHGIEITLNATTKVRFRGEQCGHCWLLQSFSSSNQGLQSSLPNLQVVAQARQFSSFIVMIGRMASKEVFQPKHAFIVRNKDEWILPLLVDPIPTAKQFRDAIESLSPEQQRFAQEIRSMQLESTLFGVCIIQIKPQLERILCLGSDSLTKEIRLTEDLMTLFIDYQISPDLLSFDGPEETSTIDRLNAVKNHVKAMMDMIAAAKQAAALSVGAQSTTTQSQPSACFGAVGFGTSSSFGFGSQPTTGFGAAPTSGSSSTRNFGAATTAASPFGAQSSMGFGLSSSPKFRSTPSVHSSFGSTSFGSRPANSCETQPAPLASASTTLAPLIPTQNNPIQTQQEPSSDNGMGSNYSVEYVGDMNVIEFDVTKLPSQLDKQFLLFDKENVVRPTILNIGKKWQKKSQTSLLGNSKDENVENEKQEKEKQAAFDLLDALTRSGALALEHGSLHVIIATTHSFDMSLMETVIRKNKNPIESVERTSLILTSNLYEEKMERMVNVNHHERLNEQMLELEN